MVSKQKGKEGKNEESCCESSVSSHNSISTDDSFELLQVDDDTRIVVPTVIDPTSVLIIVQGNYFLHLASALTILFLKKPVENLYCF